MTPRIPLAVPVNERDHRQGPASAAVTLVQYGDDFCHRSRFRYCAYHSIKQLRYAQENKQYQSIAILGYCDIAIL